jgi:hypothetical protein
MTSCSLLFLEIVERSRGKKQVLILFLSAGALWSIWKSRKKIVTSPVALIYKMLMLSKSWRPLLKPKLIPMADEMMNLISAKAASAI